MYNIREKEGTSSQDFKELEKIILNYSKTNYPNLEVYAVILYCGACKYYFNLPHSRLEDYDFNIFFISENRNKTISTRGEPLILRDDYKGKPIEIMRNLIVNKNKDFDIDFLKNFMKHQKSKRWLDRDKGICFNKALLISPIQAELW